MRIRIALLLLMTSLAGCSDPQDVALRDVDAAEPEQTEPEPGPEPESEPEPEPEPTNQAPVPRLEADVTNGTAPMQVTFTFDATDADGDALSWTFDKEGDGSIDEQGTALPVETSYELPAGEHGPVLRVFDGELEANATLRITVHEPEDEAPAGPVQTETLSWETGAFGCGAEYDEFVPGMPAAGVLYGEFAVDPASVGLAYTMVMGPVGTASLGGDISFYDADGVYVDGNLIGGTGELTFEGTVPEGAVFAIVSTCGVEGSMATYTAS